MKGTLRFFIGLLITLGAAGGMETNPDVNVMIYVLISALGLVIMYSGAKALKTHYEHAN